MPTLTYNANGGTSAPAPQTLDAGVAGTITSDSAAWDFNVIYNANGGTFYQGTSTRTDPQSVTTGSWSTTPQGGAEYSSGDSITIDADTTLYAVWPQTMVTINSLPHEADTAGNITARDDYRLDPTSRWTTTLNGSTEISAPWHISTSDIDNQNNVYAYAKWQYRITAHLRGGYSIAGPSYLINSVSPNYVGRVIDNNHAIVDGASFDPTTEYYVFVPGADTNPQHMLLNSGDVVVTYEVNEWPYTEQNIGAFYCTGQEWREFTLPAIFTPTIASNEFPQTMECSAIWLTDIEDDSILHNLVVGIDYNVSGWTSATLLLNNTSINIPFRNPSDPSQTYTVNQGTLNVSTGELTKETYVLITSEPADWRENWASYYIETSPNVYVPNITQLWAALVLLNIKVYKRVVETHNIGPHDIYVPDGANDLAISCDTGAVLGAQYYTLIDTVGDIVPDYGDVHGRIFYWKSHDVPFVSPFEYDIDSPIQWPPSLNLLRDGYSAVRFADSDTRAELIGLNPELIDVNEDPAIDFVYVLNQPFEVYAAWYAQTFEIKFWLSYDPRTGTGEQYGETQYVPYMQSAVRPEPDPAREGYGFIGWLGSYTNVDADANIIAQWGTSYIWIWRDGAWTTYDPEE